MTTRHRYYSTALLLVLFAAGCGAEPASNVPNPEVQQDSELAQEADVELSEDDAVEDASDMLDEREIDSDSAELDASELVDIDVNCSHAGRFPCSEAITGCGLSELNSRSEPVDTDRLASANFA